MTDVAFQSTHRKGYQSKLLFFHPKARVVGLVPEGLDAPLKKNKLLICACLSFDDYSLFVNANHYFPDQKLKYGDHILY